MIDRNELEDQMLKSLIALGIGNLEHADSIRRLNELLRSDYRGMSLGVAEGWLRMGAEI
ncbi:MAG: hypothetical protein WCJ66_09305 [Verrucomicrobiota bacterium]